MNQLADSYRSWESVYQADIPEIGVFWKLNTVKSNRQHKVFRYNFNIIKEAGKRHYLVSYTILAI